MKKILSFLVFLAALTASVGASARPSLRINTNESASLGARSALAVKGWSPTWIPGLSLYLDSRMGITLNGSKVSTWTDQSSAARAFTNATDGFRPTYSASDASYGGAPTLAFVSAQTQTLTSASFTTLTQPFTFFVVGESTSGSAQQELYGGGSNTTIFIIKGTNNWSLYGGSVLGSGNSTQSKQAFAAVYNGGSSKLYINSSTTSVTSGAGGAQNFAATVGIGSSGTGNQYLNGKLRLVLAYSGALSAEQIGTLLIHEAQVSAPGAWQ
jgi:hypothetical protein